jgi:polyglycine hydrolase-like protein
VGKIPGSDCTTVAWDLHAAHAVQILPENGSPERVQSLLIVWEAHHAMTTLEYQQKFDQMQAAGKRLDFCTERLMRKTKLEASLANGPLVGEAL